jgi:hypothetical protein
MQNSAATLSYTAVRPTFGYTLNGVSRTKALTRFVFRAPARYANRRATARWRCRRRIHFDALTLQVAPSSAINRPAAICETAW